MITGMSRDIAILYKNEKVKQLGKSEYLLKLHENGKLRTEYGRFVDICGTC